MDMIATSEAKAAARKIASLRRADARSPLHNAQALAHLGDVLRAHPGAVLSGYLPIRSELDPLPIMEAWSADASVCVPVIEGSGLPLVFRRWSPGCRLADGPFGVKIPAATTRIVPQVLIVPLLAFDRDGHRLGYGGGFYDRTLAKLREGGATITAIGLAFSAQQMDDVPRNGTDQQLDAIVTERGVTRFA